MKEFGEAIRSARLSAGKTLQEVARASGVSTSYVGRVERGSLPTPPSDAAIRAMCAALGLSPSPFLEMRKSFYQAGRSRPLEAGSAVEVAQGDVAALGEQAFRAAEEQSRAGNIDGATQLAEIALTLFERSRRHGRVVRAAHLLASLNLDRVHRFGNTIDVAEHEIRALGYFEIAIAAFRRVPMPTLDDRLKLCDTIAQSARRFESLAGDGGYCASLSLADFAAWTETVALAPEEIDLAKLLRSAAGVAEKVGRASGGMVGGKPSDAQLLSGLLACQLCVRYADSLYSVAEQSNKELLDDWRGMAPSIEAMTLGAMITINLSGVLMDHARMAAGSVPDEPFALMEDLATRIRSFMSSAVSTDRRDLARLLQRCHEKLGSWRLSTQEMREAAWHLHVARRLDAEGIQARGTYLEELVARLKEDGGTAAERMWAWLEGNMSDEEFRSLSYPMHPPQGMPGGAVA